MTRFEAGCVHVSNLLVGGTGAVYAWMLYAAEPVDPYAIVHHPWQPTVQHLHVLTAPLLVFAAGLIWRDHIWKHWRQKVPSRRRSGLGLLLTLVPLVASGYLIQTAVEPAWRSTWVAVHLVTAVLWIGAYAAHYVAGLTKRRQQRRALARSQELRATESAEPVTPPAR